MATKETADLGPAHAPKPEAIHAFHEIEHELKKQLVHLRHEHNKHEPESFAAARHLSDAALVDFTAADFVAVRVATTAYGLILFGKLRIPALPTNANAGGPSPAFVHFRAFTEGPAEPARFHSFHTAESTDAADGRKTFRSLFTADDPLEWFDA
ncbi:hypothetical protein SPI_06029 [Niveomyces insectorum RCEF 264]|uniref:Uncharacterized protein n=1 Tax=Niveomyces insectorum RCEF 264 TaxID=1081102 RepID=A0A167SQD8_9HYPO|nr:hypothetical protein SPI_06029 [Niveomyces insectorum RCEF 264]